MKKFIIIAGVNGAGKSTLYQTLDSLKNMKRVNTDEIVRSFGDWKNSEDILKAGKEIEMHYVGVESVEIAKERIAYRVEHGGHGIPDADVERRYVESFNNLKKVIDKCNLLVLYDNTEVFNRFAIYKDGKLVNLSKEIPSWYKTIF